MSAYTVLVSLACGAVGGLTAAWLVHVVLTVRDTAAFHRYLKDRETRVYMRPLILPPDLFGPIEHEEDA